MSIQVLYQADILLDGVAASTEYSQIKLTLNQPVKDRTAFQDTARANLPGIYAASADGKFYYQTGITGASSGGGTGTFVANKLEGITVGPTPGVFSPMILTLGADLVVGNLVNIWKGVNAKVEEGAQHGEIIEGDVSTEAAYRTVQATRLQRASVTGSSGLGTSVQLGAIPTGQSLYAALHVIGTTGGAGGTVISVVSSTSSALGASTTRITFVAGTSIVAGEWQELAGPVTDTWWVVKWTGFTGSSFTASVSAGIQ